MSLDYYCIVILHIYIYFFLLYDISTASMAIGRYNFFFNLIHKINK
jgi:hypothetical protein